MITVGYGWTYKSVSVSVSDGIDTGLIRQ
jgi:hypothetical protein